MDINTISQLVTGTNAPNEQITPPIIPPAPATPVPTAGEAAGTDFGAAGTYQQGVQPEEPETFAIDQERVNRLWAMHEERVDSFRRMVETLLGQQAERQGLAEGWSIRDVEITDELRAEAEAMVNEGGYFSVDETAARILDFAVALTGGNPEQIELMRGAVQQAFDQVERMFGDDLPDITRETHAAVMNGFDEWAEAGNAAAITLLNRGE